MPSGISIVRRFYPNVTEVVNSKRALQIEITAGDSTSSRKKSHRACAMATACKRQLGCDGAIVSTRTAYLIKGNVATRYEVPENVAREIVSFDRGAGFAPGKYALNKYTLKKYTKKAAPGTGTRVQSWDRRAGKIKHKKARTADIRTSLASL